MKTGMAVVLCGVAVVAVLWATAAPRVPYRVPMSALPTPRTEVERMAEEVSAHVDRLRAHSRTTPAPSAVQRNPFRFDQPERSRAPRPAPVTSLVQKDRDTTQAAEAMELRLIGVAEHVTAKGVERTAIVSGAGQLFMVKAGENVAPGYVVITVGPDAVELRDTKTGAVRRLALP